MLFKRTSNIIDDFSSDNDVSECMKMFVFCTNTFIYKLFLYNNIRYNIQ